MPDTFNTPLGWRVKNIQYIINMMRNTKNCFFGYSIELFDFFVYANINTVAPGYSWIEVQQPTEQEAQQNVTQDPRRFHQMIKFDSSIEHISAGAASSYVSAILPLGVESIRYKITSNHNATPAEQNSDKKLSRQITKIFIEQIKRNLPNFMPTIHKLIRDYVDYGNCALLYQFDKNSKKLTLGHLPFKHSFVWSSHEDKNNVFMYQEGLLCHEMIERYPEYCAQPDVRNTGRQTISLIHLYFEDPRFLVYTNAINEIGITPEMRDYLITIYAKKKPHECIHIVFDETFYRVVDEEILPFNPILWARNNTVSGVLGNNNNFTNWGISNNSTITFDVGTTRLNLYGRGAGIQSLSSIIGANLDLQLKNIGAILSVKPAAMAPLGTEINKGKNIEGHLDFSPGRINTVSSSDGTLISMATPVSSGVQIITQPPIIIQSFAESYQSHLSQIENSYNTEIFSIVSAPNQTATEVIQRQQQAQRQFRGQASPFYVELLLPLLNFIYSLILNSSVFPVTNEEREIFKLTQDKKYDIDIFSFEDEQAAQIKSAKAKDYIATIVQLLPLGQMGFDVSSMMEGLKSAINILDEEMND